MNSLKIYEYARKVVLAKGGDVDAYYSLLVTTAFYELVTKRESPLISKFCSDYEIKFDSKNFNINSKTEAEVIHPVAPMDIYIIVFGIVLAFSSLDNSSKSYDKLKKIFLKNLPVNDKELHQLMENFKKLDECIGNFFDKAAQKVESSPAAETQPEIVRAAYDENFTAELNKLASARTAGDEKIIEVVKSLQLTLQAEYARLQESLECIAKIRDDIDYNVLAEPINQLLQLLDFLHETLSYHLKLETSKKEDYRNLVEACNSFAGYIEQALAMLGVELINEFPVQIDLSKHELPRGVRPNRQSIVTKILKPGFMYKGKVLEKARVEIEVPRKTTGGNYENRN